MDNHEIDTNKSEAFANRMLDILKSGAIALMTSIGHRTGLFDAMQDMAPATSEEIAEVASLNERYAREWLGAMVTGKVVDCVPECPRFSLPAEHALWLTRKSTPNNISVFTQYIPEFGSVEDRIVDC